MLIFLAVILVKPIACNSGSCNRSPDGPRRLESGQTEDLLRELPLMASEDPVRIDEEDFLHSLNRDSVGSSDLEGGQGNSKL